MQTFCFAQERIILKDLNKKKHGHSRLVNWMVKMEIVEKLLAILCPFCCWESHLFQHESFLITCCSDPVYGEVLQPQRSLYLYRILTSEGICQSHHHHLYDAEHSRRHTGVHTEHRVLTQFCRSRPCKGDVQVALAKAAHAHITVCAQVIS